MQAPNNIVISPTLTSTSFGKRNIYTRNESRVFSSMSVWVEEVDTWRTHHSTPTQSTGILCLLNSTANVFRSAQMHTMDAPEPICSHGTHFFRNIYILPMTRSIKLIVAMYRIGTSAIVLLSVRSEEHTSEL